MYSVNASIMIVLIGLFVGVRDLAAVLGVFAANTAMILFGLLMERQQRPAPPTGAPSGTDAWWAWCRGW